MRIVEEGYLKRTVAKLNSYAAKEGTCEKLFAAIDSFGVEALQDLSFQSDLAYFGEMSFVLSVITSIISHPHISGKTEDIILRTELANSASVDTFRDTLRDPVLWTQRDRHMVPEYVHYRQHIDDLCIYENVFVVMLVKMLFSEVSKYADFYATLIKTFGEGDRALSLDEHNVSVALAKLQKLTKKIRYIQNTRFYKEINKQKTVLRTVHPTNILLKDRLYNYCFKFYRSLVTYPDKASLLRDFGIHYYTLLLKALKSKGFAHGGKSAKLTFDGENSLIPAPMELENETFHLTVEPYGENRGIVLTARHKFVSDPRASEAKHLLLFSPQSSFADLENSGEKEGAFTTVEAISLWNMAYVEQEIQTVYQNPLSEQEVMNEWLSRKLSVSRASAELYRSYCPSCQRQAVNGDESTLYHCARCKSQFVFFKDNEGYENLWFLKLRRDAHGKH